MQGPKDTTQDLAETRCLAMGHIMSLVFGGSHRVCYECGTLPVPVTNVEPVHAGAWPTE
jgi:hypothetical protein